MWKTTPKTGENSPGTKTVRIKPKKPAGNRAETGLGRADRQRNGVSVVREVRTP
jgi:hypothetical protein